jgi:hypothetical protein
MGVSLRIFPRQAIGDVCAFVRGTCWPVEGNGLVQFGLLVGRLSADSIARGNPDWEKPVSGGTPTCVHASAPVTMRFAPDS